jgi:hypothetical protein
LNNAEAVGPGSTIDAGICLGLRAPPMVPSSPAGSLTAPASHRERAIDERIGERAASSLITTTTADRVCGMNVFWR